MSRPDLRRGSTTATFQRGFALMVALIATIALSLACVALVRAVATDAAIGGNVALREQAVLAASVAIEEAVAALFETGAITDRAADAPAHRYFAARQAGEDTRGIPHTLLSSADAPDTPPPLDAGDGFSARHVIERLCRLPGVASVEHCTLSPPSLAAASGTPGTPEPPRTPYYRVTVHVDGPGGTISFVQAMLGEEPSHHRLSWRVLDE